jgi:hypothetical protein
MPIGSPSQVSPEVEACIRACQECHDVCLTTINHCLHVGGPHAAADHIQVLMDCVSSCAVSVDFMLRQSEFDEALCRVCADVCLRCAEDCEQMADDPMMKHCAEICRRCADACRRMSGPQIKAA